jgi:Ni,Fe-hydrogenase I large subunit
MLFFPPGVIRGRNLATVELFDQTKVTEQIKHSWYTYEGGDDTALHPSVGETTPHYTGPKPPFERLNLDEKYTWMKAPRYDGEPMEVGPLSRMLVAYAGGHPQVKAQIDAVLAKLGVRAEALFSTLGRVVARGVETKVLADRIGGWLDELADNMAKRDLRIADTSKWEPNSWPKDAVGAGFHEAPRGALAHWVHIKDRKIANYQCVVPSTWNASPRDNAKKRGPYEEALLGTPVADPNRPVEILRTLHSFDPCIACGVHVVDAAGNEVVRVRVV